MDKPDDESSLGKFSDNFGCGCGCAVMILAAAVAFTLPQIIEAIEHIFAK